MIPARFALTGDAPVEAVLEELVQKASRTPTLWNEIGPA